MLTIDITDRKLPLTIERSHARKDGEYDYAISVKIDGRKYVIGEFYGRISEEIIQDASKISRYVTSVINNSGASKNALRG